jgi:hypothetical protein
MQKRIRNEHTDVEFVADLTLPKEAKLLNPSLSHKK